MMNACRRPYHQQHTKHERDRCLFGPRRKLFSAIADISHIVSTERLVRDKRIVIWENIYSKHFASYIVQSVFVLQNLNQHHYGCAHWQRCATLFSSGCLDLSDFDALIGVNRQLC